MLATVLVAAAAPSVFVKTRRAAPRKCQVCGKDVPDLAACVRRAGMTRQKRCAAPRGPRGSAAGPGAGTAPTGRERRGTAKAAGAAGRGRAPATTRRSAARDEDTRQREEEEARQRNQVADAVAQATSDPYSILGVPRDASDDAIRAAYERPR